MVTAKDRDRLSKAELKDEIFGTDEAVARTITVLSREEEGKMPILSDLFVEEIPYVAGFMTVAEHFELPVFKGFINNFLRMRVSKDRLGRRELVGIASGTKEQEKRVKASLTNLFAGLKT